MLRSLGGALLAVVGLGCGGDDDASMPPSTITWDCPAGWVEAENGGCGPAVVLCNEGGGSPGACEGLDLSSRPAAGAPPFWIQPDGTIGGRWREPGEPGGPPTRESLTEVPSELWTPAAGVEACADGWSRAADGTCDPQLPSTCPMGAEALPGGVCTQSGEDRCPADPTAFASGLPTEGVVHVRAGADPAAADGTAANPDPTLAAALARATDGATIAIAPGTYAEAIRVDTAVTLRLVGACANRVILAPPPGAPTVHVSRASIVIEGVTVGGGSDAGVRADEMAQLVLRGTRLERAPIRGVVSSGAGTRVEISDTVVAATQPAATDAFGGRALQVEYGGELIATRVALVDNRNAGVIALDVASVARIEDSRISRTQAALDGTGAAGLWADGGARIEASRVVVEDTIDSGAYANDAGSALVLTDSIIRRTRPIAALGEYGRSVQSLSGANVMLQNVSIEDGTEVGILAAAATVSAAGVTIRMIRPSPGAGFGEGILVQDGATLTGRAISITDVREYGIFAIDPMSIVDVESVVVRDVRAATMGDCVGLRASMTARIVADEVLITAIEGLGFGAETGGDVDLEGVRVADVRAAGGVADGGGAEVIVRNARIADVAVGLEGIFGFGLFAQRGGSVVAERVLIERTHDAGVHVQEAGSRGMLADVIVDGVRVADDGLGGYGLYVSAAGVLQASRVTVHDATGVGLMASGMEMPATNLTVEDLWVRDIAPRDGDARGIESQRGATVDVTRAIVEHIAGIAVFTADPGSTLVLRDSVVRDMLPNGAGLYGRGLTAVDRSRAEADGVLFARNQEMAALVYSGAEVELADVIVDDLRANRLGFGAGIGAFDGGNVRAERLALVDLVAAAMIVAPGLETTTTGVASIDDGFVRNVIRSRINFDDPRDAAYGLYAGAGGRIDAERMRIEGGGYGTVAIAGEVAITRGVITTQLDAAGAFSEDGAVALIDVAVFGNARDEVASNDQLVEASALEPPSEICVDMESCPSP